MVSIFNIQLFASSEPKSSDDTVSLLAKVLNQLGLTNYTELKYDYKTDVNMHPLLNFVGSFLYKEADDLSFDQTQRKTYVSSFATLISKSISIIDNAATIILKFKNSGSKELEVESYSSNIASIVESIGFMSDAIKNLNSVELNAKKNKNSWLVPILTSSVALVFNGLTAIGGLSDEEYSKIQKSYLKFLKTAGTGIVKNILSNAVSTELNRIKEGKFDDIEYIKKHTNFLSKLSDTATKTIGIFFTLANSAVTGIDKYKSTFKTYTDDGIPEDMAKHDAVVNAIATVLHDLASYYTKGLDDLLFTGTQNLVSWITGKENKAFKGKNYIEVMAEMFKNFNFKNTGTSDGDYIISYKDNEKVYGEGGGDEIRNFASNVTIWAGTGNDTVFSNREWEGKEFQANSILGGKGDDVVVSYAVGDTIYGDSGSETIDASGKDKLIMYGTSNNSRAYGEKGDDYIAVFGAKKNWVNGGLGNDIIILDGAKNATVEYGAGDGNDIIYGYDESDRIQITKGKYQMSTVGSSIVLNVDNGAITLDSAYGKTININGKKIKTVENKTRLIDLITTIPSVWNESVKIVRGASKGDSIENTTDYMIIKALSGDDSIHNKGDAVTIDGGYGNDSIRSNFGSNVTIDGGAGNDSIYNSGGYDYGIIYTDGSFYNYGGNSVTIDGGAGNDTIYNDKGCNVIVGGGAGNDSIYNSGEYKYLVSRNGGDRVTIDGGTGNDSIKNSGNYVMADGGAGNDTIYNDEGDKVTIDGGYGNDSIENYRGSNVAINAGAGNDSIYNSGGYDYGGDKTTIDGGAGDDSIYNDEGYNLTISGGYGNDSIRSDFGSNVTIDGGAGDDSIYSHGDEVTINGGADNDYIEKHLSYDSVIQYASGDGKDTVSGFYSGDTLHITKGNYKVSTKNNDVIVKVGKGSITLKDAVGKQISIKNSKGNVTTKTYGSSSANVAELWFDDEGNLSQIDSITRNKSEDYSPSKIDTTSEWTKLSPTDSLTSYLAGSNN